MVRFAKWIASQWAGAPTTGKVAMIGIIGTTAVAIAILVLIVRQPTYVVLYAHLSTQDANAATIRLDQIDIPHRERDGGTMILVRDWDIARARSDAAAGGLPGGHGAFAAKMIPKGATPETIATLQKRALEEDLARLIGAFDDVRRCSVAMTAKEGRRPATAVLVLTLKKGSRLSSRQIASIVRLADSSSGVGWENVTILADDGSIIAKGCQAPMDGKGQK